MKCSQQLTGSMINHLRDVVNFITARLIRRSLTTCSNPYRGRVAGTLLGLRQCPNTCAKPKEIWLKLESLKPAPLT